MAEIKRINVGGELYDLVARSNRNLLDNWDFRKPVNQRGQYIYNTDGYTTDRWYAYLANSSIAANAYVQIDDSLKCLHIGAGTVLLQKIENFAYGEYTLSILVGGSLITVSGGISADDNILTQTVGDGNYISLYKLDDGKWAVVCGALNQVLSITAIKLEKGLVSTLENDPPMDYTTELLKCQRYFFSTGNANTAFVGDTGAQAQNIRVTIPLPVEMRLDAPTTILTSSNSYVITSLINKNVAKTLSVVSAARIGNSLFVTLTQLSEPLVNTNPYTSCVFQSAFAVSADL